MRRRRRRSRGQSGPTIRAALAALLLGASLLLPLAVRPAGAAPTGPTLRLERQTPWVAAGETPTISFRAVGIDPADAALTVSTTLYREVRSRDELADGFSGKVSGFRGPGRVASTPLAQVSRDADGLFTLPVALTGRRGILPVLVELQRNDDTLASFTTWILAVSAADADARLDVALVLPISAAPTIRPAGDRPDPPSGVAALAELAAALDGHAAVPVTVVPTPETLEGLAESKSPTYDALITALRGDQRTVLARPYVPLAPARMGDASGEIGVQLTAGTATLSLLLGNPPVGGTWVADEALDDQALARIVDGAFTRIVVPAGSLATPAPPTATTVRGRGTTTTTAPAAADAPQQPVQLAVAGRPAMTALAADPTLSAHLEAAATATDPALEAQRLLADLAAVATLAPGAPAVEDRVATVLAPRSWVPSKLLLDQLLGGLATSPVLRASSLDGAFATPMATTGNGKAAAPVVRTLAAPPAVDPTLAAGIPAARQRLSTHDAVLGPVPGRDTSDETLLLVAESADLSGDDRTDRLRRLGADLDADLAHIKMPPRPPLSLTARTGEIPITINNEGGRPAKVLLRVTSDKLEFVDGREKPVELDRANTTVRFRVKARASGTFPLTVGIYTPDGRTSLTPAPVRFTIRSSSVPGVGIVVSIVAILVLGLWWLRTLLSSARARRAKAVSRRTGEVPVVTVETAEVEPKKVDVT